MPFLLQQHPSPEDGSLTLPSPADLLLLLVPSPPTHQRRIVSWFFSHTLEHSVFLKIQWKKKRDHTFYRLQNTGIITTSSSSSSKSRLRLPLPRPFLEDMKTSCRRRNRVQNHTDLVNLLNSATSNKKAIFPKRQPLHATTSKFNGKTPSTQTKINTSSSSTSSSRFLRWCLWRDSFRCSAAAAATATPTSSSSSSSSASRSWYCCCFVTNAVAFFSACWYACRDRRHKFLGFSHVASRGLGFRVQIEVPTEGFFLPTKFWERERENFCIAVHTARIWWTNSRWVRFFCEGRG